MTDSPVTAPKAPLTRPSSLCLLQRAKCRPGNTQNGETVLPIAHLMADSESESPDSYSSFLVTMRLSRTVSETFACDGQTDRQTDGRTDNADEYGGPANNRLQQLQVLIQQCIFH